VASTRSKSARYEDLKEKIEGCRLCPGMNEPGITGSAPGRGPLASPVMLVGEALCHKCMDTKEPFTGGSERILKASFRLARLEKTDLFITNTVHCHPHSSPRDNRDPERHELDNCRVHLRAELDIVEPRLVVGLGRFAEEALRSEAKNRGWRELPWPLTRSPRTRSAATGLLCLMHPYRVMTRPKEERDQYISGLARGLRWAFRQETKWPANL
jgi:uracil-DNA glycosylase family 4